MISVTILLMGKYMVNIRSCKHYYSQFCNFNFKCITFILLTDGPQVSFIIPLEGAKDKFVISVERNVAILTWDGESSTPTDVKYVSSVDNEKELEENRLNDGKADPTGRLWSGNVFSHQ
jgi:hypothetical protein